MSDLVDYDVADGVATVTLDSPRNRNALSRSLVSGLFAALDSAEADGDVRAVLLRAAGPTFCSGADLGEAREDGMERTSATLVQLQRRLVALPKPVVARVHGQVRAGGIGLVAACDLAISTEDATFAFTEVRLALAPAAISLTVLPRLSDRSAGWSFLTGQTFDGAAAARMSLVTQAVPESGLEQAVEDTLTALGKAHPQGLAETKRLLTAPLLERIDTHGEQVAAQSAELFASEAAREAMLAFVERRKRG